MKRKNYLSIHKKSFYLPVEGFSLRLLIVFCFFFLFSAVNNAQVCFTMQVLNDGAGIEQFPFEPCSNGDLSVISVNIQVDEAVIDDLNINGGDQCQLFILEYENPGNQTIEIQDNIDYSDLDNPYTLPANAVAEGTYTITLKPQNGNACSCLTATASFLCEINDLGLSLVTQPNSNTCNTGEVDLIATTDCTDCDFSWTGPNVVNINSSTTTATSSGFYSVFITDGEGCTANASVSVPKFYHDFEVDAGLDTALTCDDPSISLNGSIVELIPSDSLTYQWFGPSITSGETTLTPTVNMEGTYTLSVTYNWSGCTDDDQVEVAAAQELPVADIIDEGAPTEINCLLTEIVLGGGETTDEDVVYQWYLNTVGPIPGESDITYTVDGPGQYSLVVTSTVDPSCSASDWVEITENTTPPDFDISPEDIGFCRGGSETCTATPDTYTYEWNTGQTGNSIEVDETGDYYVIATDATNGCKDTLDFEVYVEDPPDLSDLIRTHVLEEGSSHTIDIAPGDGFWRLVDWINVEGLSTGEIAPSPIDIDGFSLTSGISLGAVSYDVWAESETLGCPSDTVKVIVKVFKATEDLYIPEVITPNGDGQNETWDILFPTPQEANMAEIVVYNRSGGIEYKKDARDIYTPWDAIGCPDGEFFYYIVHGDKTYKGALLILRRRE